MPAKIQYLRPEGCERYTPPPYIVFGKTNGLKHRWSFRLEDKFTSENRLIVVEVDEKNARSRLFKGPPVEKFPAGQYLINYIGACCCDQNWVDEATPGHPVLHGAYDDKEVGPISFVVSHEIMQTEAKLPHEQVWASIQLRPETTGFSFDAR